MYVCVFQDCIQGPHHSLMNYIPSHTTVFVFFMVMLDYVYVISCFYFIFNYVYVAYVFVAMLSKCEFPRWPEMSSGGIGGCKPINVCYGSSRSIVHALKLLCHVTSSDISTLTAKLSEVFLKILFCDSLSTIQLVAALTFNSSTRVAEAGGSLEFEASLGY